MVPILLALSLLFPPSQTDWTTIIKPLSKQVPRIEVQVEGQEEPSICSGVVINATAGYVLSAAHCFPGESDKLSITVNGRDARVTRVNRLLDLATLRFRVKDEITMRLATESPEAGTEVAGAGFLLGAKQLHVQFGRVAAKRSEDGALVLDAQVLPGDSGGAILNTSGELVAMTNQYYRGTAISLAVPVETIRDFVDQYLESPKK